MRQIWKTVILKRYRLKRWCVLNVDIGAVWTKLTNSIIERQHYFCGTKYIADMTGTITRNQILQWSFCNLELLCIIENFLYQINEFYNTFTTFSVQIEVELVAIEYKLWYADKCDMTKCICYCYIVCLLPEEQVSHALLL